MLAHDETISDCPVRMDTPTCERPWCYVDKAKCDAQPSLTQLWKSVPDLHYSYDTCDPVEGTVPLAGSAGCPCIDAKPDLLKSEYYDEEFGDLVIDDNIKNSRYNETEYNNWCYSETGCIQGLCKGGVSPCCQMRGQKATSGSIGLRGAMLGVLGALLSTMRKCMWHNK